MSDTLEKGDEMPRHIPETITADQFQKIVLEQKQPALIFFSSDWSAPCREMAEVICQVADRYYGTISTFLMDPDTEPLIAAKYNIVSIPTLMLFVEGLEADRMVGVRSGEDVDKMIEACLMK